MPVGDIAGNVVLEATTKQVYRAANTVVVKSADGVEHVFHFAKDLVVHGGKGSGVDALEGLRQGSTVVIHYTVAGTEKTVHEVDNVSEGGLKATEGTVVRIDRGRKTITVRMGDGTNEVLQLTERAATSVGKSLDTASAKGAKVVVYYTDDAGRKVVHYFKRLS